MPDMRLDTFARLLARTAAEQQNLERRGLERAGRLLREQARDYIGEYQPAAGPFPQWQQLADVTVEDRVSKGFTPNDPLLRTGRMQRTIGYQVRGRLVAVGSGDPIALYMEMGTSTVPARSFLGRALYQRRVDATRAVTDAMMRPLLTGRI